MKKTELTVDIAFKLQRLPKEVTKQYKELILNVQYMSKTKTKQSTSHLIEQSGSPCILGHQSNAHTEPPTFITKSLLQQSV
jgi:hypothetical protein